MGDDWMAQQKAWRLRRARRDVWITWLFTAISLGLIAWGVAWIFMGAPWVAALVLIGCGVALGVMTVWLEGTRQTRIQWWTE